MNESISRAAGTQHGQEFPPEAMEALIRSIGRVPQQRDTLYRPVPEERRAASFVAEELAPIVLTPPRKRVAARLASAASRDLQRSSSRESPASSRKARVRVPADCGRRRKAARSTGWSISMAMPGWRITVGSMPQRRAASRCGKKLLSPKRSGTASGGEQITALEPRSSCAGEMVKDGAGRCAATTAVDLRRRGGGNVGRQGEHAAAAFAREQPQPRRDAAGMAVARAVGHDARAEPRGERRRLRIERDDHDAGEAVGAGDGLQHLAHHHLDQRPALRGREQGGETLLGAVQFLDRARPPRCRLAAHVERIGEVEDGARQRLAIGERRHQGRGDVHLGADALAHRPCRRRSRRAGRRSAGHRRGAHRQAELLHHLGGRPLDRACRR